MIAAGSVGLYLYQDRFSAQRQIQQLEQKNQILQQVVQRLSSAKRVAEVIVTDQKTLNGMTHTTLLFVEYARDGSPLPAKSFEIEGNVAHVDAMVIKFDPQFVGEADPLRGHAIALFTRIYGDNQNPAGAPRIDEPGKIPDAYRGADPRVTHFETDLWNDFWKLADDPQYRKERGVVVADGQGVWRPIEPDKLYTITLQAYGGLNVTSEPLKGIYREALKRKTS